MSQQTHQVEFHGQAAEYFGIWFVNVLLTILTLGIYSAWAKVRTNRYFYGNTEIDGHTFDYHATPKQILIGRLIAFAVIIVLNIIVSLVPVLGIALLPIYLFVFPWLLNRAIRFGMRMTSYRNVRFDFEGSYWKAFWVFMILPILLVFTLGLITPVLTKQTNQYIAKGSKYGDRPFELSVGLGPLYKLFVFVYGLIIVVIGAIVATFIFAGPSIGEIESLATGLEQGGSEGAMIVFVTLAIYALIPIIAILGVIYTAGVRNIIYSGLMLDGRHKFSSTLSKGRYLWITITNVILTVLTLGLMRPWAAIRLSRYVASKTQVIADGPLDIYSSSVRESSGVIAGEYFDLEGVDVGAAI